MASGIFALKNNLTTGFSRKGFFDKSVHICTCVVATCTANKTTPVEPTLVDPGDIAGPSVVRTKIGHYYTVYMLQDTLQVGIAMNLFHLLIWWIISPSQQERGMGTVYSSHQQENPCHIKEIIVMIMHLFDYCKHVLAVVISIQ